MKIIKLIFLSKISLNPKPWYSPKIFLPDLFWCELRISIKHINIRLIPAIFKLARGECKGLENESIHAIYLSKIIGTPLFASNLHDINAFEKIETKLLE